jgi:hypothetical protein
VQLYWFVRGDFCFKFESDCGPARQLSRSPPSSFPSCRSPRAHSPKPIPRQRAQHQPSSPPRATSRAHSHSSFARWLNSQKVSEPASESPTGGAMCAHACSSTLPVCCSGCVRRLHDSHGQEAQSDGVVVQVLEVKKIEPKQGQSGDRWRPDRQTDRQTDASSERVKAHRIVRSRGSCRPSLVSAGVGW